MMKFGRNRPVARGAHFRLRNYVRAGVLPAPPTVCDYSAPAASCLANIFGNDSLGDCVVAGAYHIVGVETGNAGTLFTATQDEILADYSAIGGYVPGDPSTDGGCDEVTAQNYWMDHGFADGTKLLGWLAVDATNTLEIQQACYLFENLYFGIELPDAWIQPFPSANGFVWNAGTPNPNNGHCVMGLGYNDVGVLIDSWGMIGTLTWQAISALCRPATGGSLSVWITPDQLAKGQTKAPNGFAWDDLIADFGAMGGTVTPPPGPPPIPVPPGPPTPGTAPTLADAQAWAAAGLAANWPSTGST